MMDFALNGRDLEIANGDFRHRYYRKGIDMR